MKKRNVFIASFALAVSQQTFACNPAEGTGQCTWDGFHYGPILPNSDNYGVINGGYGYSRPKTKAIRVPTQYGATGFSHRVNKVFQVNNHPSARKAKKALFKECGSDCNILTTYSNGCEVAVIGHVSSGQSIAITSAGASLNEAREKAFNRCNSKANNCYEVIQGCSLPDI